MPKRRCRRRGFSAVQWVVLAALVTVVVIASISLLGQATSDRLQNSAGPVGTPSGLPDLVGQ